MPQHETIEVFGIKGKETYELRFFDRKIDHIKTEQVTTKDIGDYLDKKYPEHIKHYFIYTEEEVEQWKQQFIR